MGAPVTSTGQGGGTDGNFIICLTSAIPALGIYPREMGPRVHQRHVQGWSSRFMYTVRTLITAPSSEQPRPQQRLDGWTFIECADAFLEGSKLRPGHVRLQTTLSTRGPAEKCWCVTPRSERKHGSGSGAGGRTAVAVGSSDQIRHEGGFWELELSLHWVLGVWA